MTSPRAACALFALAVGAAACAGGDHTGVQATPPFDPSGSEPTTNDGGAAPPGLLQSICGLSCENVRAACPGFPGNDPCVGQCVMGLNYYPGCEAEYLSYVACQATAPVSCPFGYPMTPQCDPAARTIHTCLTRVPPPPGF
jgi:hypothetical protein